MSESYDWRYLADTLWEKVTTSYAQYFSGAELARRLVATGYDGAGIADTHIRLNDSPVGAKISTGYSEYIRVQ